MLRLPKLQSIALINPSSRALPCFSSSSSAGDPPPPDLDSSSAGDPPRDQTAAGDSTAPPPTSYSSYSSYFSDIKERLKYPSPPRRIPTDPPRPQLFSAAAKPAPAHSLEEIRKHLAQFKLKPDGPTSGDPPSSNSPPPYRSLFPGPRADPVGPDSERRLPLDSIMESLKKFRPSSGGDAGPGRDSRFNIAGFQDGLRQGSRDGGRHPLFGTDKLPDSIFGKEKREKKAGEEDPEPKVRSTEFVKMYGYEELGLKLQRLRPEKDGKNEDFFSLSELNERLAKLRELEEKEMESRMDDLPLRELRNSLERIKAAEDAKKSKRNVLSILPHFGDLKTPTFMLSPPQEHLLEKYFHPDHMSSGEKLKMELKKVRDEFKMSENDCGSARVQVAQLTTKIKHLSSTLHKKDKHSRKGLHEMIQLRKKQLKYLRRTDWDSYCFVISKLGLRDVPGYKIANYKT